LPARVAEVVGEVRRSAGSVSVASRRIATGNTDLSSALAFPAWRDALPKERAAILHRWHALILEHADVLGELISLEQGKPLAEGRARSLMARPTSPSSPMKRRVAMATSSRSSSVASA
jgi:acyl-CoA reductase-like NAD-dependent aldehyde dehydrogenase